MLVSSLSRGSAGGARLEHGLSVLVELQLGDDAVGWVDANVDGGAVDLLSLGSLDVDDELLSVDGLDSTGGLSLVVASDNHDLINERLIKNFGVLRITSSSFRIGRDRTLYLVRSSFERGADMIYRQVRESNLPRFKFEI